MQAPTFYTASHGGRGHKRTAVPDCDARESHLKARCQEPSDAECSDVEEPVTRVLSDVPVSAVDRGMFSCTSLGPPNGAPPATTNSGMGDLQRHTLLNSNLGRHATLDCGMRPMPTSGDVHARRHSTSAIPGITRARLQAHLASLEQAEQAIVRELTALRQTFASTNKVRTDELRSTITPAAPGLRRASAPTASCTPSAFPSPAVSASAHSSRSPQAQPRAVPQLCPQYCPKPQPQQPQQQWAAASLPRAPPVHSSRAPQPPQPSQPVSVPPQLAHQLRSYIDSSARAESPARRTERPPAPPAPSQWPARPHSEPMDVPAFQARPASASVPRGWASPVGPSPGLQRPPSDMAALTGRPHSTLSPGGARW